jgi:hypothetical protein
MGNLAAPARKIKPRWSLDTSVNTPAGRFALAGRAS